MGEGLDGMDGGGQGWGMWPEKIIKQLFDREKQPMSPERKRYDQHASLAKVAAVFG